jgi:transcriptional regulator with XRE-family HTH domain
MEVRFTMTTRQVRPNSRLWAARKLAGYSRRKLAEELGTTEKAVEIWEIYSIPPAPQIVEKAKQLLGVDDLE